MSQTTLEYDGRSFVLPYGELIPPPSSEELSGLTESIRAHGVLHQIYHTADDVVISGSTRLVIAKSLGIPLAELPIKELATEDAEMLALQLNTTGRKWPRERLVLLSHRLRTAGWSVRRIVDALGSSRGTVCRFLEEPNPESGVPIGTPENVTGLDGKTYSATRTEIDGTEDGDGGQLDFGDGDGESADTAAAGRMDVVGSQEPTDDSPGDTTSSPKSDPKPPPSRKDMLQKFNRYYSAIVQLASALGKYQQFRSEYQKIYDGTFETNV